MKIDSVVINYQYYHNWNNLWWTGDARGDVRKCARNPTNNDIKYNNPGTIVAPQSSWAAADITINNIRDNPNTDVLYNIDSSLTLSSYCKFDGANYTEYWSWANLSTKQNFKIDTNFNVSYNVTLNQYINTGNYYAEGARHSLHTRNYWLHSNALNKDYTVDDIKNYVTNFKNKYNIKIKITDKIKNLINRISDYRGQKSEIEKIK